MAVNQDFPVSIEVQLLGGKETETHHGQSLHSWHERGDGRQTANTPLLQ